MRGPAYAFRGSSCRPAAGLFGRCCCSLPPRSTGRPACIQQQVWLCWLSSATAALATMIAALNQYCLIRCWVLAGLHCFWDASIYLQLACDFSICCMVRCSPERSITS